MTVALLSFDNNETMYFPYYGAKYFLCFTKLNYGEFHYLKLISYDGYPIQMCTFHYLKLYFFVYMGIYSYRKITNPL